MDLSYLKDLKMPNATHSWTKTMNLKGCRAKYLQNYSHMAYTSSDNRGRDFGIARTFGGGHTEGNTKRVSLYGTQYAIDGLLSVKSDLFSFGILLQEIISGKKK
ncbi:hypothetical protein QQP08_020996 [Theobroma cacao]|nr:hypothetical protein QQP08_020996 [Theobroma cacao]